MLSFQAYIMRRRVTDTIAGDLVEDIQTCIRTGKFPSEAEAAVTSLKQLRSLIQAGGGSMRPEIMSASHQVWRSYTEVSGDNR